MNEDSAGDDATRNVHRGPANQVLQARDIHGGVHLGAPRRRQWVAAAAVLAVAVVVAALILARQERPGTAPPRVSVDMSYNDHKPWGYVSESADFPGAERLARLNQPSGGLDPRLAEEVRRDRGAFSLRRHTVRLHLAGPPDRAVRITDIRPVVRRATEVFTGSLVEANPQGADPSSEVLLALDEPFPRLMDTKLVENPSSGVRSEQVPTGPYFPGHTVHLAPGETHEVVVTAVAEVRAYEYELVVVHQSETGTGEVVVNDDGRPFRISGLACTAPGFASYRAAYQLVTGFAIAPVPDPSRLGRAACR